MGQTCRVVGPWVVSRPLSHLYHLESVFTRGDVGCEEKCRLRSENPTPVDPPGALTVSIHEGDPPDF